MEDLYASALIAMAAKDEGMPIEVYFAEATWSTPPAGRGWLVLWPAPDSSPPCRPPAWPDEGESLVEWARRYGRVRLGAMSPVIEAVESMLSGGSGGIGSAIMKAHKLMGWSRSYRYRVIEYFLEGDAEGLAEYINTLAEEYDAGAEAGAENIIGRAVTGPVAHITFDPLSRAEAPYVEDAAERLIREFGSRAVVMTAAAGMEAVLSAAYPVSEGRALAERLSTEFGGELGYWRGYPAILYPEGVRVTDVISAVAML